MCVELPYSHVFHVLRDVQGARVAFDRRSTQFFNPNSQTRTVHPHTKPRSSSLRDLASRACQAHTNCVAYSHIIHMYIRMQHNAHESRTAIAVRRASHSVHLIIPEAFFFAFGCCRLVASVCLPACQPASGLALAIENNRSGLVGYAG